MAIESIVPIADSPVPFNPQELPSRAPQDPNDTDASASQIAAALRTSGEVAVFLTDENWFGAHKLVEELTQKVEKILGGPLSTNWQTQDTHKTAH